MAPNRLAVELKKDTFARTPLFASLPVEDQHALASAAVERRFTSGSRLFGEAEPCEGLWVVGEGTVKITKISPAGREIMLALDSAPVSVAEVPLFDGGNYPATCVAVEDTVAYLLPADQFRRYCEQRPEVALKVLAAVGRRLRQLVGLVEMVTFGSVRQRLARELLDQSSLAGAAEFEMPLTQEELALRLGTVREVVARNLARFQAEGMIRMSRRRLEITEPDRLRAEAEAEY